MISTEPLPSASRLRGFALVSLELALILVIVFRFDVASRNHFFPVLCLAVAGYCIHAWLPARLRAAFFCLLSLGGILLFLGWPDGAWVIGIGGGLIAICLLPVPLSLRVTLVCLAAFALTMVRLDTALSFWPVLGSMFMFRLILYLYELRRSAGRPSIPLTVAYFFPLQNVCFLFFPILDFKTFRDTYRADVPWTVAQSGVAWIARGLSHLLVYRVIKYYVLPAPHELSDLPHLALFLAANYGLYVQVSGYFHIITGIFHLFGFELPRTHDHYFLASSFTDIWRRINIPWKSFMMKIFFLPAFFTMRGWGTGLAVVAAALWVFLATWLLHVYQGFWLTGNLDLNLNVAGLWLLVGVLVAGNLYRDFRRAARPAPDSASLTIKSAVGQWLRIVGMFCLVSVFWACWNAPAILAFARLQAPGSRETLLGGGRVLCVLLFAIAAGAIGQVTWQHLTERGHLPVRFTPTASGLGLSALLLVIAALGFPQVAGVLGSRATVVLASLRGESVTPLEAAVVVQGYYEDMLASRVPASAWMAGLEGRAIPRSSMTYDKMSRKADDLLERELIPGWSDDVDGVHLTINRHGMRDRLDRQQEKPPGTRRIALVGSSVVMGYGAGDTEAFPYLLEDRWNATRGASEPRIEFLNFGTGMSYAMHRYFLIERKVQRFAPDAIFYFVHQDEFLGTVQHLTKLLSRGRQLPFPCLEDIVKKAGITPETSAGMGDALLQRVAMDVVRCVYGELAEACRKRGIPLVWVYLPMPGVTNAPVRSEPFLALAKEAGFPIIDLADWADGKRPGDVKRSDGDYHPNALGHQLIADRLESVLRKRPKLIPSPAGGTGKR